VLLLVLVGVVQFGVLSYPGCVVVPVLGDVVVIVVDVVVVWLGVLSYEVGVVPGLVGVVDYV